MGSIDYTNTIWWLPYWSYLHEQCQTRFKDTYDNATDRMNVHIVDTLIEQGMV